MAIAEAGSVSGNHFVTMALFAGYDGASNTPMLALKPNRTLKEFTNPWKSVATDHKNSIKAYKNRNLTLSTIIPPGICNAA